jgi:RNA polymerase sigma-70 factor (ECF subfamily)
VTEASNSALANDEVTAWVRAIGTDRDLSAFIALFTNFAPKLKGYLLRKGVQEQRAEELTQEALLLIWRKAEQFDPARASASAWIFTIARNIWIDAIRRERHPDALYAVQAPEIQLTPEELLEARDDGAKLRSAMQTLPKEQAEIVRLAFFDELSHTEIAEGLCIPLGTVKSRIRSATIHLRRVLRGQG